MAWVDGGSLAGSGWSLLGQCGFTIENGKRLLYDTELNQYYLTEAERKSFKSTTPLLAVTDGDDAHIAVDASVQCLMVSMGVTFHNEGADEAIPMAAVGFGLTTGSATGYGMADVRLAGADGSPASYGTTFVATFHTTGGKGTVLFPAFAGRLNATKCSIVSDTGGSEMSKKGDSWMRVIAFG